MSLENDGNGENGAPGRRRIHLREVSGDMDAPLGTVGQDLRAARLRRGDEIAQVSRALKIRKDHLEALENDRLEDLPGKTYAIGFVRSYARHLGLDAAHYVERFKQEIAGRPDEQAQPIAPIHQDERTLPHGWRIIAGVILLMLIYGAWHLLSSGNDANQAVPPVPVIAQPKPVSAPAPQPVVIPADTATPSPALDSAAAPVATTPEQQTASATPPPAAGPATPATRPTPPAPAPVAQATPSPAAPQAAVPAVTTQSASGQVYGAQNRSPRVVLRARGDTRLTVRGEDGTLYLNRDLKAGDSYQVPNITGLSLAASNAGAVEVNLDGIALGRAGQSSQVLGRVSLEPQSLMDRFNSR